MKSVLYLCHRIPFPPDKGDKIRSFHVLDALCARYRVHLGTFVDSEEDWRHVEALRARVASLCVRPLSRALATMRSMKGFITGKALTIPYYRDSELLLWVRQLASSQSLSGALVYSSGMAQYVEDVPLPVKVMDFCDLDSDKWAQYAKSKRWLWRWLYGREARLLATAERDIASRCDHSLFVSDLEADLFRARYPALAGKTSTMRNGVDTEFFDPDQVDVAEPDGPQAVFTGAMDYWANVDAVSWFAREVWPAVLARHPHARFLIVGSNPTPEVLKLAEQPQIIVTGRVPDIRPWLKAATTVVAPLRIARGLQNKVLEAMSMSRPVVATGAALQGLGKVDLPDLVPANESQEFSDAVCRQFSKAIANRAADQNRNFVQQNFSWPAALAPLWRMLESRAQ